MKLKKEWYDVEQTTKELVNLFKPYCRNNIREQKENNLYAILFRDLEDVFGFPYTSTSEFAAIWNTNCDARYTYSREWRFVGLAINETNDAIAIFERDRENDFEEYMYIIIGKVGE